MTKPAAWPQVLDFFGTPLVIEPSGGQFSGDAGLLPVCQFENASAMRPLKRLAACAKTPPGPARNYDFNG
jgi:hypothetical protein